MEYFEAHKQQIICNIQAMEKMVNNNVSSFNWLNSLTIGSLEEMQDRLIIEYNKVAKFAE